MKLMDFWDVSEILIPKIDTQLIATVVELSSINLKKKKL